MFDHSFSPAVTTVRVVALTGKKGQPPVLWEGPVATDTATIEREMARSRRIVEWLYRNQLVRQRMAVLDLQLQGYAKSKRIETHTIPQYRFIVRGRPRSRNAGDEVVLRAFDLAEHVLDLMKHLVEDRDTVIGRLVERGLRAPAVASAAANQQTAEPLSAVMTDLYKLFTLAQSVQSLRKDKDKGH